MKRIKLDILTDVLEFIQCDESGSLGDFVLEWDSQKTQDVLLRKKCSSGEEVAVSALLGEVKTVGVGGGDENKREVLMKVCIKKPSLSSILLFDCDASSTGVGKSNLNIQNAYYIPSPSTLGSSTYNPIFRDLDFELQDELKRYLEARGIGECLRNFLILHLHKKEQNQYVNWLQKLKAMIMEEEKE